MGAITKTMFTKSLILFAIVAAAAASVQEEVFVQEGSALEASEFLNARDRVEEMLQEDTMARRSACVKAADASINNVFTDVKNAQRMLNKLPNGRHCATRNQHLINRAKRTISLRSRQVRSAVNHLR